MELNNYMQMEDIPKITTPIEADSQYKLVVKLSEVIFNKFNRDCFRKFFSY